MDKKKLAEAMFYVKTTHQYPKGFNKELGKELEQNGVIYHAPALRYSHTAGNVKSKKTTFEKIDTLDVDEKKLESLYDVVIQRDYLDIIKGL